MGVSKNIGTQNGLFIMEKPIKIHDLGVPLFLETPKFQTFQLVSICEVLPGPHLAPYLRLRFWRQFGSGTALKGSVTGTLMGVAKELNQKEKRSGSKFSLPALTPALEMQQQELLKYHKLQQEELRLRQQLELSQISKALEALQLSLKLPSPVPVAPVPGPKTVLLDGSDGHQSSIPVKVGRVGRASGKGSDPCNWEDRPTTVMVRQLPRHFTQQKFHEEVISRGFEGLFDFLYLPWDIRNRVNMGGYGFVNFEKPEHALQFRNSFDGLVLEGKTVRVHPAQVQGFEANYRHFAATKTGQDPEFRPLFRLLVSQ